MKRRSLFLLALATLLALLPGCQKPAAVTFEGWSEGELRASLMLVHNGNMDQKEWDETWTVRDEEYQEQVIAILSRAEPFRPVLTEEQVFNEEEIVPSVYAVFQLGERCYTVSIAQVEMQLSLDYRYRDAPVICMGEYELTAAGRPDREDAWYCTLSAADFVDLWTLLMSYSDAYDIYDLS